MIISLCRYQRQCVYINYINAHVVTSICTCNHVYARVLARGLSNQQFGPGECHQVPGHTQGRSARPAVRIHNNPPHPPGQWSTSTFTAWGITPPTHHHKRPVKYNITPPALIHQPPCDTALLLHHNNWIMIQIKPLSHQHCSMPSHTRGHRTSCMWYVTMYTPK